MVSDIFNVGSELAAFAAGGGLLRLLPAAGAALMKFFTARSDRAHEIEMMKLQAQIAKDGAEQRLREQDNVGYWDTAGKTLEAYQIALRGQAQITGVRWVDAMNQLVRPVVTYWFLFLYSVAKVAGFLYAWLHEGAKLTVAMPILWSPADTAMLFGILGFWFVDRQLGKAQAHQWNSSR